MHKGITVNPSLARCRTCIIEAVEPVLSRSPILNATSPFARARGAGCAPSPAAATPSRQPLDGNPWSSRCAARRRPVTTIWRGYGRGYDSRDGRITVFRFNHLDWRLGGADGNRSARGASAADPRRRPCPQCNGSVDSTAPVSPTIPLQLLRKRADAELERAGDQPLTAKARQDLARLQANKRLPLAVRKLARQIVKRRWDKEHPKSTQ